MIRNIAIGLGMACLTLGQASAQQDPQMTQWFNDLAAFNIGAAGEDNLTHVNAVQKPMDGREWRSGHHNDQRAFKC